MKRETFEARLAEYFERYETTLQILQTLSRQKAAAQDIILLAGARIDSLANHALPGKTSQMEKFVRFLVAHSRHGAELERVSASDLYASVLVEWWLLGGVVEQLGRIKVFDVVRQRDFIEMYWKSGLPLTEDDLEFLLNFLAGALRGAYRVIPHQKRNLSHCASVEAIHMALTDATKNGRKGKFAAGVAAFKPIQLGHRLAVLLYREYRNGSIHGGGVDVDEEQFFAGKKPKWMPMHYEFASSTPIFQVLFPAQFLFSIYETCFRGYHKRLLATQKLPSSIFNEVFAAGGTRYLSYLDQSSIEEAVELHPR